MADGLAGEVAKVVDAVGDALDTGAVRGGAAWSALSRGHVDPPVAARRWPWAVVAAVAGAAAGVALANVAGRLLLGRDAPDAQDPADLEAVEDRPGEPPV